MTTVPAVYTALAKILNEMGVSKNGVLPSNLGGKPYITAVDLSAEVKKHFVANNLIILPRETEKKHETIINSNRVMVAIVIEGEYTVFSTVDGSSDVIKGVGDGLATGTAVASNIASTNALKNALLRTFLVTEASTEESGKATQDVAPKKTAAQQKISAAKGETAPPTGAVQGEDAPSTKMLRSWVGKSELTDPDTGETVTLEDGPLSGPTLNAIGSRLFPKDSTWKSDEAKASKVKAEVLSGAKK